MRPFGIGGARADWRRGVAFASLAVGVACLFWPLFERMSRESSDFQAHISFARQAVRAGAPHSERPGFELLAYLTGGFSDELADLARGAAVLAMLATAAKAVLTARWLVRGLAPLRASALALVVLFLAPITWEERHPVMTNHAAVHLGQISGLIFHNPTTVVVFPFALALFAASWLGRSGPASVLAAVQCFVKPNYVVAWLPMVPLLELWRGRRECRSFGRTVRVTAAAVSPAVAVLAWQFFASEKLGTIVIDPWRAWRMLSPDIPMSIVRSLAFPLLLVMVHFREVRRRPEHIFAWSIFAVAFAQYALFYLRGAAYPGNLSWGRYLAIYVVFLLGVELYAAIARRRESWRGWRAVVNGALAVLLVLHFSSGLFYCWQGLREGIW